MTDDNTWHEEAVYNIGAVSRMTGIPEATLRVWERRYGFPEPDRTEGGHRMYSQIEIDRLSWVKSRVDSGMQVSKAVRMLQNLEEADVSLPEASVVGQPIITPQRRPDEDNAVLMFRKRLIEALIAHNVDSADQVLAEVLAVYTLETLALDIISPTMHDIGEAWAEGRIGIATEHFATSHLRQHLLMWKRTSPPPYPTRPVVLACAPGEWHEGSLLIMSLLLRRLRWPCIYLGPSVPLQDLAVFVGDMQPLAIVFVAMGRSAALELREWPSWILGNLRSKKVIVTYGGRAFVEDHSLIDLTPGKYIGPTLREGLEQIDVMLRDAVPNPAKGQTDDDLL